jgi:hypothetical protein
MQRAFYLFVGVMFFCWLFISCQENTVEPTGENSSELKLNKGRVVEKVTGSGHFTTPAGDFRTFSFTARLYTDGSIDGRWVRVRRVNGENVHSQGVVTCFTIVDNKVWLGGYATHGLYSEPPDNEVGWRVVDNGQGNNSPPDQISLQFVGAEPGFAVDYCSTTPEGPAPLYDIEAGNIQLH